jgi:hypothetical protein
MMLPFSNVTHMIEKTLRLAFIGGLVCTCAVFGCNSDDDTKGASTSSSGGPTGRSDGADAGSGCSCNSAGTCSGANFCGGYFECIMRTTTSGVCSQRCESAVDTSCPSGQKCDDAGNDVVTGKPNGFWCF